MKRLIILLFLLSSYTGRTQTIVNTYDLITPIDSIWSATTELQGTFAAETGSLQHLTVVSICRTINGKTEAWFLGGYNYASESGNSIYSTGFINTDFTIRYLKIYNFNCFIRTVQFCLRVRPKKSVRCQFW